eukprot:CAMPEP_0170752402 /NCGR_PEP_ID=MMETSP0437-20130122/11950_1 /TAXON_ID=0 /ORGANISM="Sexangularia sp." /LENGTH=473 /DNA_ID=CAMNT_0011091471 /DNA_START=167 /DNA_END=1585 /DNA_ORIENTATION=+
MWSPWCNPSTWVVSSLLAGPPDMLRSLPADQWPLLRSTRDLMQNDWVGVHMTEITNGTSTTTSPHLFSTPVASATGGSSPLAKQQQQRSANTRTPPKTPVGTARGSRSKRASANLTGLLSTPPPAHGTPAPASHAGLPPSTSSTRTVGTNASSTGASSRSVPQSPKSTNSSSSSSRAPPTRRSSGLSPRPPPRSPPKQLRDHAGPVWSLCLALPYLVSGSSDGTVKVWKMPEGRVDATLLGHTGIVHCVVVTDNNLAVSGSDDKSLRVWDIRQRTCVNAVYGAHDNTICSLTIAGNRLYSGSYREVAVWDMSSCLSQKWAPVSVLSGHGHWVYSMQVLNDRYLAAGAHSLIRIWDLESFTSVQDVRTRVGKSIYALALTKDKRTLLAGTFENALLMAEVAQEEAGGGELVHVDEPRAIMDAHSACVLCLAVSDDIVFSGSYDTTVKMWKLGSDGRLSGLGSLDHGAKVESLVV